MTFPRFTTIFSTLAVLSTSIFALSSPAVANIPVPTVKPEPPNASEFLSNADSKVFRKAMSAADKRNWNEVRRAEQQLTDQTARDVLKWRRAVSDRDINFSELRAVAENQSDWPRMVAIRAKAEREMFDSPVSATKTITFFAGNEPVSGEGRAALAIAHFQRGDNSQGDIWLRKAWHESKLTRDGQRKLFSTYKSRLSKDDHAIRADHLIWSGRSHYTKAEALFPHMSKTDAAVMRARIKLATNGSGMDKAVKAMPSKRADDPGFLFERAKWRRKKRTNKYALPIYLAITTPPTSELGRKVVWREKKLMIYWLIKEKNFKDAYTLTQNHGLVRGLEFSEAEFLAGWLALRKLNNAKDAAQHFATLETGVSMPVSLSRASYWEGRAAEALRNGEAKGHYADAARYQNTFYGQLASEEFAALNNGDGVGYINMPPELIDPATEAQFNSRSVIRAARLIGETGDERTLNQFVFHLDDEANTASELSLLSRLASDYDNTRAAVRAAKQASRISVILTETAYPKPDVLLSLPDKFNKPLAFAIARQESEFTADAVSSANAYGMMQMINSTAKYTARKHSIPYDLSKLTTDANYNVTLGAYHLHDLLRKFDGSYILTAAGYNAGPHRATQWVAAYGDPRTGEIDPIDFIESIPFSETRNYVMRVMENVQVYRARLNDDRHAIQLSRDLRNGAF